MEGDTEKPPVYSRRRWMVYHAIMNGAPWPIASEAVASTAIEHPEWDMDEELTYEEFVSSDGYAGSA